jgi:hypothetical protein
LLSRENAAGRVLTGPPFLLRGCMEWTNEEKNPKNIHEIHENLRKSNPGLPKPAFKHPRISSRVYE